jgi:septal ring factor EnvC (AmiA/AmiB activator)
MTTDQKIDALSKSISALGEKMDRRFDHVDSRLAGHDQKFADMGGMFVELTHKVDTVMRQTSDLPAIRDDIAYLKIKAALTENNFSKINDQLIKMEAKDDYLLERIEKLDDEIQKIGAREYA